MLVVSARVVAKVGSDGAAGRGLAAAGGVLVEAVDTASGSAVRVVRPDSGRVVHQVDLPGGMRAGGLALVPAGLWQSTLDGGVAVLRDPVTLQETRRVGFVGEGWGLCHTGEVLVHSDGANRLVLRHPERFVEVGSVRITGHWAAAQRLGGLACVHADGRPQVWALVSGSDWVVRVELSGGRVTAVASIARIRAEVPGLAGTASGIAPAGEADLFWVSGPFPYRFKIRLRAG
ncbi:glutaminyl-peptide cyclotransferase [Actinosynnema sp. CS-041913]|uniref:glutaminyl-peptide cyclotransferase n=1 Tax=Actinosynnema sp. CS-041913 TaxID=3239917 RepID=UPI003D8B5F3C